LNRYYARSSALRRVRSKNERFNKIRERREEKILAFAAQKNFVPKNVLRLKAPIVLFLFFVLGKMDPVRPTAGG